MKMVEGGLGADLISVLTSDASPAAVVSDENDRIVLWNRAAAELLGHPAAEVVGRTCFEVLRGQSPDGRPVCDPHCRVRTAVGAAEPVRGFVMDVAGSGETRCRVHTTILGVPGPPPGPFLVVHLLEPQPPARAQPAESGFARLSSRERQVLQEMSGGLQDKEVARALGVSPATIRNHVRSILRKLQVRSRLAAVAMAFNSGWLRATGTHG